MTTPTLSPRSRSYAIRGLIVLSDVGTAAAALLGAYLIRFDFQIWPAYQAQMVQFLPAVVLIRITSFYYLGVYRSFWKYAGLSDLSRLVLGVAAGSTVLVTINFFADHSSSIVVAGVFLASAVAYRSVLFLRPAASSLLMVTAGLAVAVLAGGILVFTVLTSAPVSLAEVPVLRDLVAQGVEPARHMPRSVVVLEGILVFLLASATRLLPRLARDIYARRRRRGRRVLVYGAGDVGENLVRTMVGHPEFGLQPIGFIDDHLAKRRLSIHGIEVLGTSEELPQVLERTAVEELLIAITDLPTKELRDVAEVCRQAGITVRRVPGLSLYLNGQTGLRSLEDVDLEGLLGRTEVDLDPDRVTGFIEGRVVLVTGAGGSIGSELCRQVSQCKPSLLLLLGRGENSIYQIQQELTSLYPEQATECLIADIGNAEKTDYLFRTHRPHVVFHAAAHKHVPFMEDSPEEAVRNNIFGTWAVAQAAVTYEADRFVLISSDKAVRASSVMGATKRIAELIAQHMAARGSTRFVSVRFGNVLRSRGSVVPLFERQIAEGGPVTVTHPDMTRYFMSIPEAVRLVLHSGAVGDSGDLCILDMGEPVNIATLAENMIRMAGKRPYDEIKIEFTGIRPGEKLYEELLTETEAGAVRKVDKILVCRPEVREGEDLLASLECLRKSVENCAREEIIELLGKIIPDSQLRMSPRARQVSELS
jgi:FlaA1/EpsC-like NDP-sugar epimerase